jgi:hypothetical protein
MATGERTANLQTLPRIILLLILVVSAFSFQRIPIPLGPADEDSGERRPQFCQNWDDGIFEHNCECPAMRNKKGSCHNRENYGPDSYDANGHARCTLSCERHRCRCHGNCTS